MRITIVLVFLCIFRSLCFCQDTAIVNFEQRILNAENDSVRVVMLLTAAWNHKYSSPERSHRYINKAIQLAVKRKNIRQAASGYYYKSVIYYLTTKYDSSLIWSEKARADYEKFEDNYGLASIYNVRGLIDEKTGDYEGAIKEYQESLRYAEKTDNLYGQSNPLHNIGLIYNKTGDYKQALAYVQKALKVREQIKDSVLIAQSFQTIGMLYNYLGDTTQSIEWQEKAIAYFQKKENWYDLAIVYSNLGSLYTQLGDLDKAFVMLNQARTLSQKIDDKEGLVKVLINLAELDNRKKSFAGAERYAKHAIAIADSLKLLPELKLAYEALAVAQEGLHKFREGFYTQNKLRAVSDSLLNTEKVTNMASLEARYQLKEKEQQISLQQAQILQQETQIKYNNILTVALILLLLLSVVIALFIRSQHKRKQEAMKQQHELSVRETYITASLQSQENERKRVALDLHDGMGQLISSLRLTVANIGNNLTTEERLSIVTGAEKVLNDMHREIRSIAFNLMPQTLIQFGLVPALKEMAQRVTHASGTIVSVQGFDLPERLSEVQEISVYRVLQEWINNVLKYAAASRIEIQLVAQEDEITITVEDDGKGFDTALLTKGAGHGWKNISSRVNLIKGTVDVDSTPGKAGTTLIIGLPIHQAQTTEQNVLVNS